jgi:hypothetical protein
MKILTRAVTNSQHRDATFSYDDVDVSVTSGYKPMIVVAVLTIITFLFSGGLPICWGDGQGYTLFTYGSIL